MFLKWFSRFTDSEEAGVYRFLYQVLKYPKTFAQAVAARYLQQDVARLIMLLEWKFKGYKHLTKRYRRQCYQNLECLKADFAHFANRSPSQNGAQYLSVINHYLHQGRVEYRAGSSFDKLCVDPQVEKLVGDCNQLVALYVYLFALKYDIKNLKLKLLPGHVCLHYQGKDYETTSGQITHYKKFTRLAPITELVSITLLDESDKAAQHKLPPENQLLCAQLALVFTGSKAVARHNIKVSQQALLQQALKDHRWRAAHGYARALGHKKWLQLVHEHQGFAALKKQAFSRARTLFGQAHSARGKVAADQAEINALIKSLQPLKTMAQFRAQQTKLKQLLYLARRHKKTNIIKWCQTILKKL